MKTPDIVLCPDQYFRRVIYGLGPHIADYPEQATLTWILLNWCPTYVIFIIDARVGCSLTPNHFKLSCSSALTRHSMPSPVCDPQ